MAQKQARQTLRNQRGDGVSPRFLGAKLVRAISDDLRPRSVRLALGVSQGLMGTLLANSIGRHHRWSRWCVRNWEAGSDRQPMTALAREAYRRLVMDVLLTGGLFLRRRHRRYEAVRVCRRCRRLFAVTSVREKNCRRCRR